MRKSSGFSLTEIIIAIAIIVLFITLPLVAYNSYIKRARDDKRKTDLLKIGQALEQYKAQKLVYPPNLSTLVDEGYLQEIPLDPRNGQAIEGETGVNYQYSYSTDGVGYQLSARLEGTVSAATGGSGTGTGTLNTATINGTFSGTGTSGAVTGNISINGTVTSGNISGSFTGSVTGSGIVGLVAGTISGPIAGTANGTVAGTGTVSGSIGNNLITGSCTSCSVTGVPATGATGSGSGTVNTATIIGNYNGSGTSGPVTGNISISGIVTGGNITGTFTGTVTGTGISGSVSGTITGPVSGSASGAVNGTGTISGTLGNNLITGNCTSCSITGSVPAGGAGSGPGTFIVDSRNPGGTATPNTQLTQYAQTTPTSFIATKTPYQSPPPLGSITLTPSPSRSPTPSFTPTNTPTRTPTPSNTPTPTPYKYVYQFPSGPNWQVYMDDVYTPSGGTLMFTAATNSDRVASNRAMTKLVYSKVVASDREIYDINIDGTGERQLTNTTGENIMPAYSPDGTRIVFASSRTGSQEIYIMNSDGTGQTRLTTTAELEYYPSFSQDGSLIVYSVLAPGLGGPNHIKRMTTAGASVTTLASSNTDGLIYPSYSPDGTKIVYTCVIQSSGTYRICNMNANGTSQQVIRTPGDQPSYIPDGRILYMQYGSGTYRMNADGTSPVVVNGSANSPFAKP